MGNEVKPDVTFVEKLGMWWPTYEPEPERTDTYIKKRVTDVDLTAGFCGKRRRTVVQAGGHVGLFPLRLALFFEHVLSFEADPHAFECLKRNTAKAASKISVIEAALGERAGEARLALKFRSGAASIRMPGDETAETDVVVPVVTIDSLGLTDCDALVIDVEHYECEVLKGAAETIARCNPVIHVEELPRRKDELQALIKGMGYVERRRVHGDAIYTRGRK